MESVIAILALTGIALAEGVVIFALINRLLAQAKIAPIASPLPQPEAPKVEVPERRKLFSLNIPG